MIKAFILVMKLCEVCRDTCTQKPLPATKSGNRSKKMNVLKEITENNRGWELTVNGSVMKEVSRMTLKHSNFGVLTYGDAGGYDSWNFREIGGGGSVIVPYYVDMNGRLFVGLVLQNRPNQGGKVWNVPRGFLSPGENHLQAATREGEEETGYRPIDLIPLGEPMNPNSAFFDTSDEGAGVKAYRFRVAVSELREDGDGFVFDNEAIQPTSKQGEQIFRCRFFPVRQALEMGDMFTVAAAGRLLAEWHDGLLSD